MFGRFAVARLVFCSQHDREKLADTSIIDRWVAFVKSRNRRGVHSA